MMRFKNVCIESLAYALPDQAVTSEDIEKQLQPLYERLKLPIGRLELMTGIKERRFWSHPIKPSEASTLAAQAVLKKSQFKKESIDFVIHGAVSRDCIEPATAAYVHGALDLPKTTQIMDLSNACLGFINAMVVAANMIESGMAKCVLIVAGENGKPLLDETLRQLLTRNLDRQQIKPYFANLTIGAGAAAMILSRKDLVLEKSKPLLQGAIGLTDSSARYLCQGDRIAEHVGLQMQTDAEALLKAGLNLAEEAWKTFLKFTGWNVDTPERVITHQVGKQHQLQLYERLNVDLKKDFSTFSYLGNIGAASLPLTLAQAVEQDAILSGDSVALLGIGSGLSCLMLALEW